MSAHTTILGTLGRDPELKYFESGSVIASFSLACNRAVKGEQQTDWWNCKAWGKTAEIIGEYVRKGQRLLVHGNLEQERWTDKESGQPRTKTVIRVNSFDFIERRNQEVETESAQASSNADHSDSLVDMPF